MVDALTRLADAVEDGKATDADFDATGSRAMYGKHYYAKQAYNGSLDAAKALHEAVLPNYGWGAGPWGARVWLYSDRPHWDGSNRQEVDLAYQPARAWLLAILRALAQVQK